MLFFGIDQNEPKTSKLPFQFLTIFGYFVQSLDVLQGWNIHRLPQLTKYLFRLLLRRAIGRLVMNKFLKITPMKHKGPKISNL